MSEKGCGNLKQCDGARVGSPPVFKRTRSERASSKTNIDPTRASPSLCESPKYPSHTSRSKQRKTPKTHHRLKPRHQTNHPHANRANAAATPCEDGTGASLVNVRKETGTLLATADRGLLGVSYGGLFRFVHRDHGSGGISLSIQTAE